MYTLFLLYLLMYSGTLSPGAYVSVYTPLSAAQLTVFG